MFKLEGKDQASLVYALHLHFCRINYSDAFTSAGSNTESIT